MADKDHGIPWLLQTMRTHPNKGYLVWLWLVWLVYVGLLMVGIVRLLWPGQTDFGMFANNALLLTGYVGGFLATTISLAAGLSQQKRSLVVATLLTVVAILFTCWALFR